MKLTLKNIFRTCAANYFGLMLQKKMIKVFTKSLYWSRIRAMLIITLVPACFQTGKGQSDVRDLFLNPPEEAKPRGYWVWAHGNFDYPTITEELEAFKTMGLGGVDIYDMGIADPYNIIPPGNPFMSEQMLDGIEFAMKEAKRLDLSMGLSVSNGWNAGGEWTTPDEKIMRLLFWRDTLQGPGSFSEIGFPEIPTSAEKPYGSFTLYPQIDGQGFPEYYEDVALLAYPLTPGNRVDDPAKILFFDPSGIDGNTMDISLPEGAWVLARAVVTPLGQRMWMRSDRSDGWIMDHYSRKATRHHFEHVIGRLENRLGNLSETALERLYLASFEAEDYIIWSPELKQTFYDHHGYEMDPYIPVFAGLNLVNEEISERFLYDYRYTISEMFVNNHYRQARDICHRHGLLLASESGGPGPPLHYVPTEDLKALGSVDVMRGEFWNRIPQRFDEHGNDITHVVKNIASAAHIYGRKIVEMEAFTSHNKHWQEQPITLKKLADKAFCEGMTRVVYHTMPHSPKEAGIPGWSYQAGTHIHPKMTWWDLSGPFHKYLARTSALLQMGHFVADVVYYYGEEIPKFASGSKYIRETLGPGYEYDDLNKEVLMQSRVSEQGHILLPSGMTYRLLVLPPEKEMSLEVLRKIEELLNNGASILGDRPVTVPGLKDFENREEELKLLADKIWRGKRGKSSRSYGKGTIYSGYTEREILESIDIHPDFRYSTGEDSKVNLDFIHRVTDREDIYFVSNEDSLEVQALLDFRIDGKQPYLFDAVEGNIRKVVLFDRKGGRTRVPVGFAPYGSVFIVFINEPVMESHAIRVERNGKVIFPENLSLDFNLQLNDLNELVLIPEKQGDYRITLSDGNVKDCASHTGASSKILDSTWTVTFEHGWGFEPLQKFDSLLDWTLYPDAQLSIYSGTANYSYTYEAGLNDLRNDHSAFLDLGKVGEVARVYLNGHELGTSVFPPFEYNLKGHLKEGENYFVIEVANTWLNQLVGELDKPFDEQRTRSNVGRGSREEPVRPWDNYNPIPSGLIGPVRLIQKEVIEID